MENGRGSLDGACRQFHSRRRRGVRPGAARTGQLVHARTVRCARRSAADVRQQHRVAARAPPVQARAQQCGGVRGGAARPRRAARPLQPPVVRPRAGRQAARRARGSRARLESDAGTTVIGDPARRARAHVRDRARAAAHAGTRGTSSAGCGRRARRADRRPDHRDARRQARDRRARARFGSRVALLFRSSFAIRAWFSRRRSGRRRHVHQPDGSRAARHDRAVAGRWTADRSCRLPRQSAPAARRAHAARRVRIARRAAAAVVAGARAPARRTNVRVGIRSAGRASGIAGGLQHAAG